MASSTGRFPIWSIKLEKLQQLEDANTEWLKYLDGEIPKRKKKTEKDLEKVLEEPAPVQPQKKRRSEKSSQQVGVFLEEN